ncbi:MAG: DUF1700 domain-containing protein [Clostridia bacterium]|nr:DUF1700 domain-containing protein [Clostridia bacterium]MDY3785841.1 DUF1700 domain-containing protein [Eubacteriales bacterium]
MTKQEFLAELRRGLSGLPQNDIEERLNFYSEMIDDRMEEGLSEQEAVDGIGSVDSVVSQILGDIPLSKLVKEKITPKKQLKAWIIVLIILGAPIWFSLAVAAVSVAFALYFSLWSIIVSLWAAFASLVICVPGGIAAGLVAFVSGGGLAGIAMMGAGLFCAGLSVFAFFGCKALTKGTIALTKKVAVAVKRAFIKNK